MSLKSELAKYGKSLSDLRGYRGSSLSSHSLTIKAAKANSLEDILSQPIEGITSRDQIIDPYSLVNINDYKRTARGKALYQQDLDRAILYKEQQEAAYKEWYESPEQVAFREREAGRNPDLIDGLLGNGESADTETEGNPMEGIPTIGEQALNFGQGITALAGTIGSLMAVPSQIMSTVAAAKLAKSQNNLVTMQGLKEFETLIFNDLSSRVAQGFIDNPSFNVGEYLAGDFEDVFSAYAPADNAQYRSAFKRAIGNVQRVSSDAYERGATTTKNKSWFARELAHPYNDPDLTTMIAQWEPVEEARQQMDVIELEMRKLFADIKKRYATELNPEELAQYFMDSQEFQALHQKCLALAESARYQVQANLLEQYNQLKGTYFGQMSAMNCMSLLLGHGPMTWQQELTNYTTRIVEALFPTKRIPDAPIPSPSIPSASGTASFTGGMSFSPGAIWYDHYTRRGNRVKFGE